MNLQPIKDYWQILVTIVMLASWWGTTGARLSAMERDIGEHAKQISSITSANQAIDVRLSRIETDIQWIRQTLDTRSK